MNARTQRQFSERTCVRMPGQRRIRAAAAEVTLRRWQRDGGGCGCTGDCGNTALRRLESGGRSDNDGAMAVLETAAAFKCATVTAG
eukprot:scaffold55666_cov60-Phaeocystis_antarctica.AAC.1